MIENPTRSFVPRKLMATPDLVPIFGASLILAAIFFGLAPLAGHQLDVELSTVELELAKDNTLPPGQIVVRATLDGALLNGTPVSDRVLSENLSTSLAGQPDPIVILDADPDLPYERVVYLLDTFKQSGAKAVGLAPNLALFLEQSGVLERPSASDELEQSEGLSPVPSAEETQ